MNKEYLKEKVGVYKTLTALFWTGMFVLGGGLVHYSESVKTLIQKIIFAGGIAFEIILFFAILIFLFELKRLLKKIKGV